MILLLGLLFTLLFFAIIGAFMLAGSGIYYSAISGSIAMLINAPSVFLILVSLLFFMLVTKSGKIIGKYISASFKRNYAYSILELEELHSAIKNTIKFILWTGGFCFMSFAVISLGYIGSPEKLGPNLAISLISVIYSIAVSFFIFFPVQAWAENKINMLKNEVSGNQQ